jgi:hypothetical protein
MHKVAELRGQARGFLVTALLGETRITADVRDQERADGCVWRGSQPRPSVRAAAIPLKPDAGAVGPRQPDLAYGRV